MVDISIIIPCYNSSHMISGVVQRVQSAMKCEFSQSSYEIILIDDSSPDDTYAVISGIAYSDSHIKAIGLARNFGQHSAIMAGFTYSSGNVVVCLDDDGQTPPEEISKLVSSLNENCDLVYAKYDLKHHSPFRNFGSWLNDKMACLLIGKPEDLYISSFFAAKRYLIDEALHYKNAYPYLQGLMLRSTTRISNVLIEHQDRLEGSSGYSLSKLLGLWMNGFTAFSVKPLRVASFLGIAIALLGFLCAVFVVVRRIVDSSVQLGWSSLFALMLLLGGLILFVLGLIGEYVGRSYISLNSAPQFIIRNGVNIGKEIRD